MCETTGVVGYHHATTNRRIPNQPGEPMDAHEQMALDLELAQQKRYRKHQKKGSDGYDFWSDTNELDIFEEIKAYRRRSYSFHPMNQR